jgi:hypothetical protein
MVALAIIDSPTRFATRSPARPLYAKPKMTRNTIHRATSPIAILAAFFMRSS